MPRERVVQHLHKGLGFGVLGFGVSSFGFRVSGLSHRRGLGLLERGQLDDLEVIAQLGEGVVARPCHARHAPHLLQTVVA